MQFLKTVFWAFVAAVVALFAWVNWTPVTINLWSDIQADVKLPLLLSVAFFIGFLPTWLILRAKLWSMRRRLETHERNRVASLASRSESEIEEPVG